MYNAGGVGAGGLGLGGGGLLVVTGAPIVLVAFIGLALVLGGAVALRHARLRGR